MDDRGERAPRSSRVNRSGDVGSPRRRVSTNPEMTTTPVESGAPIRPDLGPPAAGAQPVEQSGSGLGLIVSVLVAAVVFGLAVFASGQATPGKAPMFQTTTPLYWFVAVLVIVGAGAGAQYAEFAAERGADLSRRRNPGGYRTAWIVPAVSTLAAVLLVATFHNPLMMVAGPIIAFLGNAGALLARDLLDNDDPPAQRTAITIHTLVVHAVAFLVLSAIYLNKLPTPVGAILVAICGGLLILEAMERGPSIVEQRVLYAGIGALVLAEALTALNWWQTNGWTGGAVLLVCFYLAAGVLLASTRRSELGVRDAIEFGLVGFAAILVLAITA